MPARPRRAPRPYPITLLAIAAAGLLAAAAPAHASDIDTEHLFGFSEGADIGKRGERELESETVARAGKAAGHYGALTETLEAKYVAAEGLRLGARASFAYFGISGVPGFPDRGEGSLQGFSFEARYALVNRAHAPFGLDHHRRAALGPPRRHLGRSGAKL